MPIMIDKSSMHFIRYIGQWAFEDIHNVVDCNSAYGRDR